MFSVLVQAEQSLERQLGGQVGDGHGAGSVLGGGPRAELLVVEVSERLESSPVGPLRPDPLPAVEWDQVGGVPEPGPVAPGGALGEAGEAVRGPGDAGHGWRGRGQHEDPLPGEGRGRALLGVVVRVEAVHGSSDLTLGGHSPSIAPGMGSIREIVPISGVFIFIRPN